MGLLFGHLVASMRHQVHGCVLGEAAAPGRERPVSVSQSGFPGIRGLPGGQLLGVATVERALLHPRIKSLAVVGDLFAPGAQPPGNTKPQQLRVGTVDLVP